MTIQEAADFPWLDNPDLVFSSIEVFLRGEAACGASYQRHVRFAVNRRIIIRKFGECLLSAAQANKPCSFSRRQCPHPLLLHCAAVL